jgi:hypothetical protein
VKRFLKVFILLFVGLFLLVSGVDATLDQLSRSPVQNSYTFYSGKGHPIASYAGDLSLCKPVIKPVSMTPPIVIHRT